MVISFSSSVDRLSNDELDPGRSLELHATVLLLRYAYAFGSFLGRLEMQCRSIERGPMTALLFHQAPLRMCHQERGEDRKKSTGKEEGGDV